MQRLPYQCNQVFEFSKNLERQRIFQIWSESQRRHDRVLWSIGSLCLLRWIDRRKPIFDTGIWSLVQAHSIFQSIHYRHDESYHQAFNCKWRYWTLLTMQNHMFKSISVAFDLQNFLSRFKKPIAFNVERIRQLISICNTDRELEEELKNIAGLA